MHIQALSALKHCASIKMNTADTWNTGTGNLLAVWKWIQYTLSVNIHMWQWTLETSLHQKSLWLYRWHVLHAHTYYSTAVGIQRSLYKSRNNWTCVYLPVSPCQPLSFICLRRVPDLRFFWNPAPDVYRIHSNTHTAATDNLEQFSFARTKFPLSTWTFLVI